MMNKSKTRSVNLGLIGVGRIGRVHAQNIAARIPGARLAALADLDGEAAKKLAARLKNVSVTTEYGDLLDDPDIDAIVISSPTNTHAQIIEQAAMRKMHIFCEKPIDLDLSRIQHALAAVKRARVKLQIGFNRRFHPPFARARNMIAQGKIGDVHLLRITSRDPAPPPLAYARVSGGIFMDMTIHDFDMARFLTGSEVVEVYATGGTLIDRRLAALGDVDTCMVTLRFKSGAIASIDNSRQAVYGYDQRIEIFGSDGMISAGETQTTEDDGPKLRAARHGPPAFFAERYGEALLAEMRSFVDSVRRNRVLAVTGQDGLAAARIGFAAMKSMRENRPVTLAQM